MDQHLKFELLEGRFHRILARFRLFLQKYPDLKPFVVEFFGTPKAGKTTIMSMARHFLRRNGWRVTARPEGAEAIDWARVTPQYNEETWRYAMSEVYQRLDRPFELIMLDRGLMDNLAWMDYWRKKEMLLPEDQKKGEAFKLSPIYRDMFDLHVCMVCEMELSLERELANAMTKKDGDIMNRRALSSFRESHDKLWERLNGDEDDRLVWHDTSKETPFETTYFVLTQIADAFERRIAQLR